MEVAKRLIGAAAKAGADAVKFQTFDAEKLEPPGPKRTILSKLQLSRGDHFKLRSEALFCGVEFMSTPFDIESLFFLAGDVGVKRIKLASGALFYPELLNAARAWKRPIILSTGMADIDAIGKAVGILRYSNLSLLHCVSAYPTPINELNVSAVKTLKKFGVPVGLSDHSLSLVAPSVAVSMGATIIEKHIKSHGDTSSPDHMVSLDPDDFKKMVEFVRETEKLIGDGEKLMRACEAETWKTIKEREAHRLCAS